MAKIPKSVRVDPDVFSYIEKYKGNGFNEKFENIIKDAMESEKNRLHKIKELDKAIAEKEKKNQELIQKVRKLEGIVSTVNQIITNVNDLEKRIDF